ncbi:hypothetical protein NDU88_009470 [Pleurodeles waltl]|uniref:Uncharacterized protein n=1 Tax=Pleurodeles waltl TaxID=8319 RepID=A0AAV7PS60_PLEWA|nr:hypothetical protein NDU88_009470 [Pleurodeles waltl]
MWTYGSRFPPFGLGLPSGTGLLEPDGGRAGVSHLLAGGGDPLMLLVSEHQKAQRSENGIHIFAVRNDSCQGRGGHRVDGAARSRVSSLAQGCSGMVISCGNRYEANRPEINPAAVYCGDANVDTDADTVCVLGSAMEDRKRSDAWQDLPALHGD